MANMLADGLTWLSGQRHSYMASAVTYIRGVDSVSLSATVGRTQFAVDLGGGMSEVWESRDFIIRSEDLVIGSSAVVPQAGDTIRQTVNETAKTFEVMAPSGHPPYRLGDPNGLSYRVHTKYIGDA